MARRPNASWQLQEAKARFSEVVRAAMDGRPQIVTYRGREAVVVVSVETFRGASEDGDAFKAALLEGPSFDGVRLPARAERSRDVDL